MNTPSSLHQAARHFLSSTSSLLSSSLRASGRLLHTLARLQRIERNGVLVLCIPGAPIVRLH